MNCIRFKSSKTIQIKFNLKVFVLVLRAQNKGRYTRGDTRANYTRGHRMRATIPKRLILISKKK